MGTESRTNHRATTDHARADTIVGTIRVLLVDDHTIVRAGLRHVLSEHPTIDVVGEAGTAEECRDVLEHLSVDVALIDVRLPGTSGIELCRELRLAHPQLRCVMLTGLRDDALVLETVAAGAAGYLHKDIGAERLVQAIRRVAAGAVLYDPARVQAMNDRAEGPRTIARGLAGLTERERSVVDLVATGMTNRQIAGELWLAEKTVRNYVSTILGKVGLENRTALAAVVTKVRSSEPAPALRAS